jgi:hypothetical protein
MAFQRFFSQIKALLRNGFIRPLNIPMACSIVAVLKRPSGNGGVCLAIYYQLVNFHSQGNANATSVGFNPKGRDSSLCYLSGTLRADIGNQA